ncbi:MAG: DUF397 domain-containing protein [Streptomyces sp.]|uniref:DUF397 domain-containing protein n=1 Tax=Streptomyces sp. TaxID=1931 RepID=UPI003D6B3E90
MNIAGTNTAVEELGWFKSSYSGAEGGECIEVAPSSGIVHIRDSKTNAGPILSVPSAGWAAFVEFAARG